MTRPVVIAVICALICAFWVTASSQTAHADRYYAAAYEPDGNTLVILPKNAYAGAALVGTRIVHQKGSAELLQDGAGFALYAGIRLDKRLALEAGWTATLHNPAMSDMSGTGATPFGDATDYLVLHGLTADAKLYLSNMSNAANPAMEPYLQGGVGVYLLDRQYFGTEAMGTGFQLGGGIDFLASPKLRLGLRALYRGISMAPPNSAMSDTFIGAASVEATLLMQF